MARWGDLIGKRMQMAHARGEALIAKRRKAKLMKTIAEYEGQRRPSEFVTVLGGIALMAYLDAMLLVVAILVFCAAMFLTAPPHVSAIVVIAAWVVIWVATRYGRRVMARWRVGSETQERK